MTAKYLVDFKDFEDALRGSFDGNDYADTVIEMVSGVLVGASGSRAMQLCMAKLLRERGWGVMPPADETQELPQAAEVGRG